MKIQWRRRTYPFQPWRPQDGRVLSRAFSFDIETTMIDEQRPWLIPAYVLGAAFDGNTGYFVTREHAPEFLHVHVDLPVAMHHAAFDLSVIHALAPDVAVYGWVTHDN